MRDILPIGPAPSDEPCAQVGELGYAARATLECNTFRDQLIRQFGKPPSLALIRTQWAPHDFGSYAEVVISYDPEDPASIDYAFNVESNCPEHWDAIARQALETIDNRNQSVSPTGAWIGNANHE